MRVGIKTEMAFAVAVFGVAAAVAYGLGYRFLIPYEYPHLLAQEWLREELVESLWHLHAQPPALNLWLGLALKSEAAFGPSREALLLGYHLALGSFAMASSAVAGHVLISRPWMRLSLLVLIAAHPVLAMMLFLYTYTFQETGWLLILAGATAHFSRSGSTWSYLLACGVVILLSLTHALFHPIWGLAFLGGLMTLQPPLESGGGRGPSTKIYLLAGAVLALLAWPAKNALLFGRFTSSTWTGFNIAQGLPIDFETLPSPDRDVPDRWSRVPALASFLKPEGSRNMNHISVIDEFEILGSAAWDEMRNHPGSMGPKLLANYRSMTRFSGRHPFTGALGVHQPPPSPARPWLSAYEQLLFQDFRSARKLQSADPRILPPGAQPPMITRGGISGFYLTYPIILVLALIKAIRTRTIGPPSRLATALIFNILWLTGLILFVDGSEGNRLRFPVEPYFWLLFGWVAGSPWPSPSRKTTP